MGRRIRERRERRQRSAALRALQLGFVQLGDDVFPATGKEYPVVPASSADLAGLATPETPYKGVTVKLLGFWVEDLPDSFSSKNEVFLSFVAQTRDPKTPESSSREDDVVFSLDGTVRDGSFMAGALQRKVFANVVVENDFEFSLDLVEKDNDLKVQYDKVKGKLGGLQSTGLDVLEGIPYVSLATSVFEGLLSAFGKNADDPVWGECPVLSLVPGPGAAFLRSGIYVLIEKKNVAKGTVMDLTQLRYKSDELAHAQNKKLSTHAILSVQVKPFEVKEG